MKPRERRVGILQVPPALFAPRKLFSRVENVKGYGWTLLLLLTALAGVGYAKIESGLIDRQVRMRVLQRQAKLEEQKLDVVERSAFKKALEEEEKRGEFERLTTRVGVVLAAPLGELACILLIAAILYAVVALSGRKPEWHTLMTICVFAAFADLLAEGFRLVLMLRYGTLEVDTSAALLARLLPEAEVGSNQAAASALPHLLGGIDPFRAWFWFLVPIGLSATAQLRRWQAWLVCLVLFLISSAGHAGMRLALHGGFAPA